MYPMENNLDKKITKIALFQKKQVRNVVYKGEWWFSITDVCGCQVPEKWDTESTWFCLNKIGAVFMVVCILRLL